MVAALLLILAIGLPSPQIGDAARRSDADFARAVQLQQAGDLEGARDAYESSLKIAPNRFEALSNLGVVYARLGQYDRAIELYKRALVVDPKQQGIRLNLGIAYFQTARFDLVISELATVLAAQPANNQARLLRGLSLLQIDKVPEAIKELEKVHAAVPDDLGASYGLALAYIAAGDLEKATAIASTVFARLGSAEGHLVMGSLAAANRDYKKAIDELSLAKILNPKLPTVNSRMGSAYLFAGERDQAIRSYEAEIEVNPLDFEANARLGDMYREDGRLDEAGVRLQRALELRPDDYGILYQLAQLAQAQAKTEDAVKLLERVVAAVPDFLPAHVLLARLYFKLKRTDDAARERSIVERLTVEQQERQPGGNAQPTGEKDQ